MKEKTLMLTRWYQSLSARSVMQQVLWLFFLFMAYVNTAFAHTLNGLVIKVADGDTLTILSTENVRYRIRLVGIDAPEKSQAFGPQSTETLRALCLHHRAFVSYDKRDRYRRILGRVYCADNDANLSQITKGMAWVYRRYSQDKTLLDAEANARAKAKGLWSQSNPTAPWQYRRMQRHKR